MIFSESLFVYMGYSRAQIDFLSIQVHNALTVHDNS